jgi:hypothetical protein
MKKLFVLFLALCCASGLLFAQNQGQGTTGNTPQNGRGFQRQEVPITAVSGKLAWVNGRIAVKAGEKTIFASGLKRLIGFVDGIKEGADVKLEGREFLGRNSGDPSFFQTIKVTFNGKEYDIPDNHPQKQDERSRKRNMGWGGSRGSRRCHG